jgi:hypothetical protein
VCRRLHPCLPLHPPRGTAGVAIIWPKTISDHITPLPDGSERVAVIQVQTEMGPLIVINTYMPTSGTLSGTDYNAILQEVREIQVKFSDSLVGDINASVFRPRPSDNDVKFKQFCSDHGLNISRHTPRQPTYYHFTNNITSTLDYFVVPSHQPDIIHSIYVDTRNPTNCSLHDAVLATLCTGLQQRKMTSEAISSLPGKLNWNKIDKELYHQFTDEKSSTIQSQTILQLISS